MFCFVMLLIFYFVKHSYPRVRISSLEIHLTGASSLSCFSSVRHHSLFIKCLPSSEWADFNLCSFRYQPAKVDNFYCLFGCISITTHTRSFEFSRLSHYLIIKVLCLKNRLFTIFQVLLSFGLLRGNEKYLTTELTYLSTTFLKFFK